MKRAFLFALILFMFCNFVFASNISILNTSFEPVYKGLNYVNIEVENKVPEDQIFAVHIYTRSPRLGKSGVGWGRPFFYDLKANEKRAFRVPYKIQGPVTPDAYVRLSFGNPKTQEEFNSNESFNRQTYTCDKLPKRQHAYEYKRADEKSTAGILAFFEQFQQMLKQGDYEQCWYCFSEMYQKIDFNGEHKTFQQGMDGQPPFALFCWKKITFLNLTPKEVMQSEAGIHLSADCGEEQWRVDFVRKGNGDFKILYIDSASMPIADAQNWEQTLLSKLEKYQKGKLEIYYYKDSTASRDIDLICSQREAAIQRISEFAGIRHGSMIRLVFFEDPEEKILSTGHQGNGWAFGNTIVEVYNDEVKLDPYHEIAHIVMGKAGEPPAIFNEGYAVYISEQLGSKALKHLSGGEQTILEKTQQLKKEGELIALKELMTYTEIGSKESNPPVAYAEAGCFVKYLCDTYGKDSFLKAYQSLKNSNKKQHHKKNLQRLKKIYDKDLKTLESEWHEYIDKSHAIGENSV